MPLHESADDRPVFFPLRLLGSDQIGHGQEMDFPIVLLRDRGTPLPKGPEIGKPAQFCHEMDPEPIYFRSLAPVMLATEVSAPLAVLMEYNLAPPQAWVPVIP